MSAGFDPDSPARGGGLFGLQSGTGRVVVLPVPFEATTSCGQGTAEAPQAVLEASWQVDLCDLETGSPWKSGIVMEPISDAIRELGRRAFADAEIVRSGDRASRDEARPRVNAAGAELNGWVRAWTATQLEAGRIPVVLGGDHSVPFGAIQAAVEHAPGLGILHIDAHADLREAYEGFTWSHASILHNVLTLADIGEIVQVGVRDVGYAELARIEREPRLHLWSDDVLARRQAEGEPWARLMDEIVAPLPRVVWLTFDVDGLDPSLCPGTGTPVPGGLSWREALLLLSALVRSGRQIIGFDICEIGSGDWDATVGARLLYKLAGWALLSQENSG